MEKKFTYNGKEYTMTYTLDIIRAMEANGFSIEKLEECPATNVPLLFAGALMAKQKRIPDSEIKEVYSALPNKRGLINMLKTMYMETVNQLIEEPEEQVKNQVTEICW